MFYKEIPGIKPIYEQFVLADDSPSGLRHRVGGDTGPVAGTPCTVFFPGEGRELFRQQHLQPMNYEVHIHTGWRDVTDLGTPLSENSSTCPLNWCGNNLN